MSKIIHHHLRTIDSTIVFAKEFVKGFDSSNIILITADEQTAGRGRLKSQWTSPPFVNIYATFCHGFDPERYDCGNLAQVMGVSVSRLLNDLHIDACMKWPNDILVNGKKIAGIICELKMLEGNLWVFNSVGVNVNMSADDLRMLPKAATSMSVELNKEQNVSVIIKKLCAYYEEDLKGFLKEGYAYISEDLQRLTHAVCGNKISFRDSQEVHEGVFLGIDDRGSLKMQVKDEIIVFHSGSIEF
jgi:BirA family biotin operon repressor/biotin-[acetyl-CoA-carboxylase] ligase